LEGNEQENEEEENEDKMLTNIVQHFINRVFTKTDCYLFLVDEYTGRPVYKTDSPYPIPITKPRDWVKKNISMIHLSVTLMMLAGKASSFFVGIPDISSIIAKAAKKKSKLRLPIYSADDLVAEVAALLPENKNQVLTRDNATRDDVTRDDVTKVAIESRENLWKLLKEHDQEGGYAGLQRVVAAAGDVHWTLAANKEKLDADNMTPKKTPQPAGHSVGSFL
jgi:hypothetical protein